MTIDFQDEVSEDDSHMGYTCFKKQDDVIGITLTIRTHRQNVVDYR